MSLKRNLFFLFSLLVLCFAGSRALLAGVVVMGADADTVLINSIYREASQYLADSANYKQADILINKAWKKSIEISYQEGVADGYFLSAHLHEQRDSLTAAIDYFEKARSIYLIANHQDQIVNAHLRLANLYAQQDQLFLAHRSYREAIKVSTVRDDSLSMVDAKARIEYADFKNNVEGDYHGAILLLDSLRTLASEGQIDTFKGRMLQVSSDSYFYNKDYGQAMYYAEKAVEYHKQRGNLEGLLRAVLSQARIYEDTGDLESLDRKIEEAEALGVLLDTNAPLWTAYQMLKVKSELRREQYESALARANSLATYLQKRGNNSEARKVLALMANANYVLGRLDEANQLFDTYRRMNDSLLVEQFVQADAELSDKFVMARQEDVDRLKLSNTIYQRYGLIVSVVVLLAVLVILYIHFREKDKLANRVAIKNAEISVQNEILKQANIQNELLLREIHHRVKNNLQMINSLLSLQARKTTLPEVVEVMKESRSRLNSIALIHNKLYQQYSLNRLNIHEYIEQLGFHLLSIYNVNNNEVDVCVEAQRVSLDIDTAIPVGLVLTELITNSLKYAFVDKSEGKITIAIEQAQNAGYRMVYADDGKGMPAGKSSMTDDTLGFKLIRSLVDQLSGDIDYVYENGWSKFVIHFQSHS